MLILRSLLYQLAFYLVTAGFLVLGSPLLFLPRPWAMAGLRLHAQTCIVLLRLIAGTRLEVRGAANLPPGPLLVAAKHQSAWDTFGLVPLFADPALVMKAELMSIPLYGWFSRKFAMIPVRREAGPSALREMVREAKARITDGRQVLVFPEGTRMAPHAEPDYKPGFLLLYDALGVPCVPVAVNSGVYWPRRSFLRRPGTIVVEILPPIPPGLRRAEFRERAVAAIEGATSRLVAEGEASIRSTQGGACVDQKENI